MEGILVERNVGEKDHTKLQVRLASWLEAKEDDLGICVFPEQRIQVSSNRFRVPDLCVVAGANLPNRFSSGRLYRDSVEGRLPIEAKDGILQATNPDVILPPAELFAD